MNMDLSKLTDNLPVKMDLSKLALNNIPGTVSVFVSSAIATWLVLNLLKSRDKKGAWGVPFVGYLPFLGPNVHKTIHELAMKFGDTMWLRVGFRFYCILNSFELIKELTKEHAQCTATKPVTVTAKATKGGAHYDTVPGRWKKRKTIIMRALRMVQKQRMFSVDDIGREEIALMVPYLQEKASKVNQEAVRTGKNPGIQLFEDYAYHVARVMYRINLGTAGIFDKDIDGKLHALSQKIAIYSVTAGPLGWFDVLPFWRHIKKEQYNQFCSFHTLVGEICGLGVERFLADGKSDGCIAGHFYHLSADLSPEAKAEIDLTDEVLFLGVCDVFRAGTESTMALMYWFTLYMMAFPEVQARAREEVDEVCNASFSNLAQLHYLQSLLHEIYRHACLAPFGKREASKNFKLSNGTEITKGQAVLLNFWAVSRNPQIWKDPSKFDPTRFLKEDGTFDAGKMEYMLPFGAGMRRCPGEASGKILVAMLSAAMLTHFEILPPTGVKPDIEPMFGISLVPKPYQAVLKPRH